MVVPLVMSQADKGDVQPALKSERSLRRIALEAAAEEFGAALGRGAGRLIWFVFGVGLLALLHPW